MKLIVGLGNPGDRYDATRHNVGWWAVDRLAYDWDFGPFEQDGPAKVSAGVREGKEVLLLKPTTFMNRSGAALHPHVGREGLDISEDFLVIVDDAALEVGRLRFRPRGGDGGHNGLRSIRAALGGEDFARLRVGVGRPPPGTDLVQWVLSPMEAEDEDRVLELLSTLSDAVDLWIREGTEPAMNEFNR